MSGGSISSLDLIDKPHPLPLAGFSRTNRTEIKDEKLGKAVKRIWEERGGILSLTEHDLLTSSSSSSSGYPVALDDDDGRARAGSTEGLADGLKEADTGQLEEGGLDLEGMRAFKTEVWGQLECVHPSFPFSSCSSPSDPLGRYE